jgi:exonuclease III
LLRQNLKVATWNVRTLLLQPGKLKELCDEATLYQLDLVGVQEGRWQGKGKMVSTSGHTFIHSGKEVDSHTLGIRLLLTPSTSRACLTYECHSDRLLSARFTCNCGIINMTVVVCYAPTEVIDADTKDQFYQSVDELLQKTHKHDIRLVLGDYNARDGNARLGYESEAAKPCYFQQPCHRWEPLSSQEYSQVHLDKPSGNQTKSPN